MAKRNIITIRVDDELKKELDLAILRMRKSQTEIIEKALREVLKKRKL